MRDYGLLFWALMSLPGLMTMACQPGKDDPRMSQRNKSPTFSDALAPANMARVGAADERYQSYNVEMLEVTGGKFWKPSQASKSSSSRIRACQQD